MRIVQPTADAVEVREQQIPVDDAIHHIAAGGLFERQQGFAGCRQQCAPTAAAEYRDRGLRAVALGTDGDVERDLHGTVRRRDDRPPNGERPCFARRGGGRLKGRRAVTANRDRRQTRNRRAFEQ